MVDPAAALSLTSPSAESSAAAKPVDLDVETCPNCNAPRTDTSVMWCRKCGYHPTLDRVIDLVGEDLEQETPAVAVSDKPSAKEGLKLLFEATPAWMRRSAMAAVAAALLGVLARMFTEPESLARLAAALVLLFVAKSSIVTAHVWSFFYAVPESDRLGIGDLIVRPFYVWSPTMRDIEQPGVWRRPALMAFGIVAEVVGLAVVGGIPWARVWELGPAEPPKRALAEAVANVGKTDETDDTTAQAGPAKAARPRSDCVIIGYVPSVAGRLLGDQGDPDFSSLVLATEIRGNLTVIGAVSGPIPDAERAAIRQRLKALNRASPVIPCTITANWLEPVLACRVTYTRAQGSRFENLKYDKLLAELP